MPLHADHPPRGVVRLERLDDAVVAARRDAELDAGTQSSRLMVRRVGSDRRRSRRCRRAASAARRRRVDALGALARRVVIDAARPLATECPARACRPSATFMTCAPRQMASVGTRVLERGAREGELVAVARMVRLPGCRIARAGRSAAGSTSSPPVSTRPAMSVSDATASAASTGGRTSGSEPAPRRARWCTPR